MKVQMHSIKFNADQKLVDFVEKKLAKLNTFYDRIIDGEVFMRIDKDKEHGNKIIEVLVNVPGVQLFAKEQSTSFEAATDSAVEGLKRQLLKHKEKQINRQI